MICFHHCFIKKYICIHLTSLYYEPSMLSLVFCCLYSMHAGTQKGPMVCFFFPATIQIQAAFPYLLRMFKKELGRNGAEEIRSMGQGLAYIRKNWSGKHPVHRHKSLLSAYNNETVVLDGSTSSNLAMIYIDSKSFLTISKLTLTTTLCGMPRAFTSWAPPRILPLNLAKSTTSAGPAMPTPIPTVFLPAASRTALSSTGAQCRHRQCFNPALPAQRSHHRQQKGPHSRGQRQWFWWATIPSTIPKHWHRDRRTYAWAVDPGVPASLNQARNGDQSQPRIWKTGVSPMDAPAGIYVDGGRDIQVFDNVVYNNGNGLSLGLRNGEHLAASFVSFFNNRVSKATTTA